MRRDYFTLEVSNVDWATEGGEPAKPTVIIDFEGPTESLRERLTAEDGDLLDASEVDAAVRLQPEDADAEASGVVSVTNRITGDFVLELDEDADDVLRFIRAARRYGEQTDDEDGRYHVGIRTDGEPLVSYDKRTFLVYNEEGNLLRKDSLIPSGVEL